MAMKQLAMQKSYIDEKLAELSWETIVNTFAFDLLEHEKKIRELLIKEDKKTRRKIKLDKELAMYRLILIERLKHKHFGGEDAKLLMDVVKILKRCEQLVHLHKVEMEVWFRFLFVVIEKLKKERLVIYGKKGEEKRFASVQQELEGILK